MASRGMRKMSGHRCAVPEDIGDCNSWECAGCGAVWSRVDPVEFEDATDYDSERIPYVQYSDTHK